jgi:hypothetical protein
LFFCKKIIFFIHRKEQGQILFILDLAYARCRNRGITWSPSGSFLLVLEEDSANIFSATNSNKIRVLFYNQKNLTVNEINFGGEELLVTHTLNSRFLWLDGSSFIFGYGETRKFFFKIITISEEDGTFKESIINLSKALEPLILNNTKRAGKFVSFVSSLFVVPSKKSSHFFFLSNCPLDHQHQVLIYVDRLSHKIVKTASLPGEVVEISVGSENFFLLLQSRPTEDYRYNSVIHWDEKINIAEDLKNCFFSAPWICKQGLKEPLSSDTLIFEGSDNCVLPFNDPCCCLIKQTIPKLKEQTNKATCSLVPYLSEMTKTSDFFVTSDFVYFVDKIRMVTHVRGIHHHFEYKTEMKDDFLFPPRNCVVYFHPNKPIFLLQKPLNVFEIYLAPWATDDDLEAFPEIPDYVDCPDYNEKRDFYKSF